jgi:hypothetical protein
MSSIDNYFISGRRQRVIRVFIHYTELTQSLKQSQDRYC